VAISTTSASRDSRYARSFSVRAFALGLAAAAAAGAALFWITPVTLASMTELIVESPEPAPMYRHMRVGEFLTFMARLRRVPASRTPDAVARVAEQLSLSDKLDAPIPTLSRGYRQRVCIAQALVHSPQLLILDEPTNGLDPLQIIEMRRLIRSLAGRYTVLMSSHILPEVAKTADRVAVLLGGRLKGERKVGPDDTDLEDWFLSLA